MLPSEYFQRNVSVVYTVDEACGVMRYNIGVGNLLWGPDFPHSSSSWPIDYEIGLENLQRAGCTQSEIDRIMVEELRRPLRHGIRVRPVVASLPAGQRQP